MYRGTCRWRSLRAILAGLMALELISCGWAKVALESEESAITKPLPTLIAGCNPSLTSGYGGGAGTSLDPYLICTMAQWEVLRLTRTDWSKSFKLTANLDMTGYGNFAPIGDTTTAFTGTLDGDSKTISSLNVTATIDNVGLFGILSAAQVKDLSLVNFSINANGHSYIGALAGKITVSSTISNISVTNVAIINGFDNVGAVIGLHRGSIDGSLASGSVAATGAHAGGLVGYSEATCTQPFTSIQNSSSAANISGGQQVGGVIGYTTAAACGNTIKAVSATGSVQGTGNDVGGLIGSMSSATLSQSFASAIITAGSANNVGGLVGNCNNGTILESFASGSVTGASAVGGLAGLCKCTVRTSNAKGNVSGNTQVGGFFGSSAGSFYPVKYSYSLGQVTAASGVAGGFAGYNNTSLSYVYAAAVGGVAGTTAGGLIGQNDTSGSITTSYFDTTVSGVSVMCGSVAGAGCNDTYGKSTVQLQTAATYSGVSPYWNFIGAADGPGDLWKLSVSNYPILYWENIEPSDIPPFDSGTGTETDPYVITTAAHVNQIGFSPLMMKAAFRLGNNIDLASIGTFYPIGETDFRFGGIFDGNGKSLSNLVISSPATSNIGLFGISEGTIKNLSLTGFSITANQNVGSVVGILWGGSITDVNVNGALAGSSNLGLLAGAIYAGSIISSTTSGTVTGGFQAGGLVGLTASGGGSISNSSSSATITGTHYLGGLVGKVDFMSNCAIHDSYASGNITGSNYLGGLVGYMAYTVKNSYATGTVSGNNFIGGLIGETYSPGATVTKSYATGPVTGSFAVGGLVGWNSWVSGIATSYATGNVTGSTSVGGLVGYAEGILMQSYATGNVLGDDEIGGLVGRYNPTMPTMIPVLHDCYARGDVTGRNGVATQYIGGVMGRSNTSVDIKNIYFAGVLTKGTGVGTQAAGGLIGYNDHVAGKDISASFWDQTLNPTLSDIGAASDAITNHGGISGDTSVNMTGLTPTIYTGASWDFTLKWDVDSLNVNAGYPTLRPDANPNWNP